MVGNDVLNEHGILENISQSVIVIDLNGIVMYWNKASEQTFGYAREEMIHEPISKIYPEFARDKLGDDLERLRAGEEIKEQWKSLTKGGEILWIDLQAKPLENEDGEITAIIASAYNIQKLKEVEIELEERKAQAQVILETTVDGIVTMDEKGKILSFNKAASRIFGYSEEEAVDKNINILMPEPHHSNHEKYLERYKETGEKRIIGLSRELSGKHKDGTVFPLELSVSEVTWRGNRIFTGVINNITERRRLENEILRVSEEERQRLGQDLHDGLGQMLTGIGLISQNLARKLKSNGIPGSDEVQEISDMIKEADEYAKTLAHGLVHADVEEGIKEALGHLCKQANKFFKVDCEFNCDFEDKIQNTMTRVNLYRIAQEAISNAAKHGNAEHVDVQLEMANGVLRLEIIDDGVGFSKTLGSKGSENKGKGMGIRIMGYRSNMMSGHFDIKEINNHTHVICSIPLENI